MAIRALRRPPEQERPGLHTGAIVLLGFIALGGGSVGAEPEASPAYHGVPREKEGLRVYTYVPFPDEVGRRPYGHGGVYFYGKERIEVPGAVAVNKPPYVCDLDQKTFPDKERFVAHLRAAHGKLASWAGGSPFVVLDGQVHFIGDE